MKLTYWVAISLGDHPSVISKTKHGCRLAIDAPEPSDPPRQYLNVSKRTITFADSFDLFEQATAPDGGRGMGEKS